MRRSARQATKQAKVENEAQHEPKIKKKRSNDKITIIATLDNGTMVEAFKFLNYSQLAKKSLVSMRFCNLIRTHRNSLALLYVDSITMKSSSYNLSFDPASIRIFNNRLFLGGYNKWVSSNNYSKQIPLKSPDAKKKIPQEEHGVYELSAIAVNKDRKSFRRKSVLFARIHLNHESWPLYQHFVCLLADPFIYIRSLELIPKIDALNLLAGTIISDRNRLQCNELKLNLQENTQEFITWIKDHTHCDEFRIYGYSNLNYQEEFLNFFMTGANCTSKIDIVFYDLSITIIDFVQKFMDIKSGDENQVNESIKCYVAYDLADALKRKYSNLAVKEENDEHHGRTTYTFEFINANIRKKLQLTATKFNGTIRNRLYFVLKIENL